MHLIPMTSIGSNALMAKRWFAMSNADMRMQDRFGQRHFLSERNERKK